MKDIYQVIKVEYFSVELRDVRETVILILLIVKMKLINFYYHFSEIM